MLLAIKPINRNIRLRFLRLSGISPYPGGLNGDELRMLVPSGTLPTDADITLTGKPSRTDAFGIPVDIVAVNLASERGFHNQSIILTLVVILFLWPSELFHLRDVPTRQRNAGRRYCREP